jgi:environmental stress-induced protein Ves
VVLSINGVDHRCEPGSVTTFRGDDVVFATLIDGPMRALNLMVRDGAEKKSLQLSTVGQVIDRCSVVMAVHSPSQLIVDKDEISLQILDGVFIDSRKKILVLEGIVATI